MCISIYIYKNLRQDRILSQYIGTVTLLGASAIAKYLGSLDSTYSSLFWDTHWRDMFDKPDSPKLGTGRSFSRTFWLFHSCLFIQLFKNLALFSHRGLCESISKMLEQFFSMFIGPYQFLLKVFL